MKSRLILPSVLAISLATLIPAIGQVIKTPLRPPRRINPQLYREDVNAQDEINRALASAAKQHKRVLLDFGGNWCIDCHILENAFQSPRIDPLLEQNFVVVHVDVGKFDKNLDLAKRYRVDLEKGVPSLAVLNARGGAIYSTGDFERARVLSEEDVIAFLDQWKPSRPGNASSGPPGAARGQAAKK